MSRVLFLCSGNFYRSRFAEILFNHLAVEQQLPWRSESRGFRFGKNNVGPISPHTIEAFQERGIPLPEPNRFPLLVREQDFETSQVVVALKEAEHRPLMLEKFPAWAERITYWHVDDLDFAEPNEALAELEQLVHELADRLAADNAPSGRQRNLPCGRQSNTLD